MSALTLPCAVALACAALSGSALAQDGLAPNGDMPQGFSGTVGLGTMYAPAYLGARDSSTRVLPMVQLRWGPHWFAGVDGAGYRWGLSPDWQVGLRVGLDQGRDEDDAAALKGLGDVPARVEVGGFGTLRLLPFLVAGTGLRLGSGADRNGLVVDSNLRSMLPLGKRVRLAVGVGGTWANQASMQSLFGVTDEQAARSVYPAYQPAPGWRDVYTQLMAMSDLGDGWQLIARLDHKVLVGDAERSPLVQDGRGTSSTLVLAKRF